MISETKRFFIATGTLVGAIIGVGIFGVPYALSRVGAVAGIAYFVVLGGVQLLQHLFYAEAAIACPDKVRLPGLAERYLGRRWRHLAAAAIIFAAWGAMTAYVIVGGRFLFILLGARLGGAEFSYQIGWALATALVVYFGLEFVSRVDFIATVALLAILALILALGAPHVRPEHFVAFLPGNLFLPYGVILFSLSGLPAILEMEDILKGRHRRYRAAIVVGTLVGAALTAAFGFVVWGVSGAMTTTDAVAGLRPLLGPAVIDLAAALGFLSITTSYFATAINLRDSLQFDAKLGKMNSWLVATGVPIAVFLFGVKNFFTIINFTGAVFGGIVAILVAALYVAITRRNLVKEKPLGIPVGFAYLSIAVLATGAIYQIAATVMK